MGSFDPDLRLDSLHQPFVKICGFFYLSFVILFAGWELP